MFYSIPVFKKYLHWFQQMIAVTLRWPTHTTATESIHRQETRGRRRRRRRRRGRGIRIRIRILKKKRGWTSRIRTWVPLTCISFHSPSSYSVLFLFFFFPFVQIPVSGAKVGSLNRIISIDVYVTRTINGPICLRVSEENQSGNIMLV